MREEGLIPALRTLARPGGDTSRVKATDIGRLDPAIEATAYYIAAEATANAVKHARAHQVEITLARTPQALQLTITDDGVGERPSAEPQDCRVFTIARTRSAATSH